MYEIGVKGCSSIKQVINGVDLLVQVFFFS